ncbi:MAG: esterase-like activity of phytase family protein [Pseudomonadota bacterium]
MHPRFVAIVLTLWPVFAGADGLEPIGASLLETEAIKGVSGLEVAPDGLSFTAVTDRGWWATGRFERTNDAISSVVIDSIEPILGSDGFPVAARRAGDRSDAEGLAIGPDGRAWVSFERWAHVWRYDEVFGTATWIKDHPTFRDHADNWQLEAAAVAPDGTVYVFSEKPLLEGFPIYRLGLDNLWTIDGFLPERDIFAIVGADFADDGALYLLERKLVVGIWWQNRIRRVRLDGSEDVTLWTGERGEYENLEGISVWRDEKGLRLTLVSDNNGTAGTPTQFVEFRLTE